MQRVQRGLLQFGVFGFSPGKDGQRCGAVSFVVRAVLTNKVHLAGFVGGRVKARPSRRRPAIAHIHRSWQCYAHIFLIGDNKAIAQRAQPGRRACGVIFHVQMIPARLTVLDDGARERAAIRLQQARRLRLACLQPHHIGGERDIQKFLRFVAKNLQGKRPGRVGVAHIAEVRVAILSSVGVNPCILCEAAHTQRGVLQHVEGDFGPELFLAGCLCGVWARVHQDAGDDVCQFVDLILGKAALGNPGQAQANAGRPKRAGVAGDGLKVAHDASHIEQAGGHNAAKRCAIAAANAAHIDNAHVRIGSLVNHTQAFFCQARSQTTRIGHRLMLKPAELLCGCQPEGNCQPGDLVHVGAALFPRKNAFIQLCRQVAAMGDDDGPTRPLQRLMRGKGNNVGDADGAWVGARRNETRKVSHISQQQRPHSVGNFTVLRPVWRQGEAAVAPDENFGPVLQGHRHHGVVVQVFGGGINAISHNIEDFASAVRRSAVAEVPAPGQVHAHDRIARLQQRCIHGAVGWRAGKWLHIHEQIVGAHALVGEKLCAAAACQRFDDVGVLCAFVVALVASAAILRQPLVVVQQFLLAEVAGAVQGVAFCVDVHER